MKAAELAREAAREIQKRGLNKGAISDPVTGAVCLHGALNCVFGQAVNKANEANKAAWGGLVFPAAPELNAEYRRVHLALADRFDEHGIAFPGAAFNDAPETTVSDVAKLFLELADTLDFE